MVGGRGEEKEREREGKETECAKRQIIIMCNKSEVKFFLIFFSGNKY